jgi:L-threonylcarbamoyladenylate synthase
MMMIEQALDILRAGGLVAFPSETVYGLGADARRGDAVRRIFLVKGRPPTNPLIVHVSCQAMAEGCADGWPEAARRLARAFWPGPLTMVVPRSGSIAAEVSAGLATVGLRMPAHPMALELIRRFDGPIAAPSANRSTQISPTTAEHVRRELGDGVDLILDGGACSVGIESTVIDLASDRPTILRPGAVSIQQIEHEIGAVQMTRLVADTNAAVLSPGQHERHYAPSTMAVRFDADQRHRVPLGHGVGLICLEPVPASGTGGRAVAMPHDPAEYARRFYAVLRDLDGRGSPAIWIEMPPDEPAWLAVRDRIRRATQPL